MPLRRVLVRVGGTRPLHPTHTLAPSPCAPDVPLRHAGAAVHLQPLLVRRCHAAAAGERVHEGNACGGATELRRSTWSPTITLKTDGAAPECSHATKCFAMTPHGYLFTKDLQPPPAAAQSSQPAPTRQNSVQQQRSARGRRRRQRTHVAVELHSRKQEGLRKMVWWASGNDVPAA